MVTRASAPSRVLASPAVGSLTAPPRLWSYTLASGVQGDFVTADAGRCPRPALADVLVHPGVVVLADARALIAGSFAALPGLSICAASTGRTTSVIGDRSGAIAVVLTTHLRFAGAAAHAWRLSGRRLPDLGSVRVRSAEPGPDPRHLRPADLLVQLQRLDEVPPRRRPVIVALHHVGEADQHIRLVDR